MNNDKKSRTSIVKVFLFSLALCALSVTNVFAQNEGGMPLTAEKQKQIINNFSDSLTKYYFFQDSAKIIVEKLDLAYKNGVFNEITNDSLFAVNLTQFIRSIVSDNHLGVRYRKTQPPPPSDVAPRSRDNMPSPIEFKILENNIGYLRINMFDEQPSFYEKFDSVFQNLKETKALIIDLSSCGGGSPRANKYVISHFLQPNTQLTSIFNLRNGNIIETENYSLDDIKSERYTDKPIFIITGKRTFSAAESFCYDLQVLKRATIVGVNTVGGANPGREFRIGDSYVAFIPTGQSLNHITKSNWEGVGIIPDILTSENEALSKAISLANEK